ncbi:MAG: hypothetical protein Q8O47_01005 [Candidatus Bathyarchaeota archaeon]|nr:hypothetical protein [Candidatus Bathyarchaeota archaeon]
MSGNRAASTATTAVSAHCKPPPAESATSETVNVASTPPTVTECAPRLHLK